MTVALCMAMALALTGCGSSGGSEGGSDGGSGSGKLGSGKIGFIQSSAESERVAIWSDTAEAALDRIGWEAVIMDGKGDPGVQGSSVQALIAQQVDGIVLMAVDPGPIRTQLEDAKDAGIPIIAAALSTGGPGMDLLSANYAPEDEEYGRVLAEYLAEKVPGGGEYVQIDLTPIYGAHLAIVGAAPLLEEAGWKEVGMVDLDPANLAQSTQDAAASLIQAHPKAKVLFSCCDFTPAATNAVLADDHPDVIQLARYDNPSALQLIREGANLVLSNANADTGILIAIDQILAHKVDGAPIDPKAADGAFEFEVIDASNVPPEGETHFDVEAQIDTYVTKWEQQYE
ncbi:sugar ABC transporter substrate-binding protein [Nocardioides endophyticus]|uniref:sugar ABC transporter substrate-binding protein n=1 Tax=Nocardioides endophyticus TaxID=1353775 RepID=UPI0031ED446A